MKLRWIKDRRKICLLCSIPALFFLLAACGGGSGESTDTPSSEAGSISFNLVWQPSADQLQAGAARRSPSGDVCDDYGIDTIDINVRNSSGTSIASDSWRCDRHQGKFDKVPVGSGLSLTISGNVADRADWQGQATGIRVIKDEDTDVGVIEMAYIGSDHTSPTASYRYPADGAADVPINALIVADFSEEIVDASVNTSSCALYLAGSTTPVDSTVSYDPLQLTATIDPAADLAPNANYTVTITTEIEDLTGHPMAADYSWSFTTGAIAAQTLTWGEGNWGEALWD